MRRALAWTLYGAGEGCHWLYRRLMLASETVQGPTGKGPWSAALATEARRAETVKQGSVHEGAGPKDNAHDR